MSACEWASDDHTLTELHDPVREKQWLGSQIVANMSTALLTNALAGEGTVDCDTTLSDCISVVLQAALCCRAGDMRRNKRYDGEEYLRWEDLQIGVLGTKEQHSFGMVTTLKHTKGFKRNSGRNVQITLRSLGH